MRDPAKRRSARIIPRENTPTVLVARAAVRTVVAVVAAAAVHPPLRGQIIKNNATK